MRMHFWHAAGSAVDIVQSLLSEILAHGSTGVPPSPSELLDMRVLYALEGVVCRAEMTRFYEELQQLADDLRDYTRSDQYCFTAPLVVRLDNAYSRIDALAELSRATFPAFEENWFVYTSRKVLSDFIGLFVQRESARLASAASSSMSFDSALYAARLSTLLQMVSDAERARGLYDLIVHALNVSGENPLFEYYRSVTYPDQEMINSFNVLLECAYLERMLGSSGRFVLNDDGTITDTVTGLFWLVFTDDPGWRPRFDTYYSWAENLGEGWRLPSSDELTELYDAGITADDRGPFQSSLDMIWTGEFESPGYLYVMDFSTGSVCTCHANMTATGIGGFAVFDPDPPEELPLESLECGIGVGTADTEVISILGDPDERTDKLYMGATGLYSQQWIYEGGDLVIYMSSSSETSSQTVSQIRLSGDCDLKTSRGVGLGCDEAEIVARYGHIRDDNFSEHGEFFVAGSIYGGVGFRFTNGFVSSITIGAMAE